MKQKAGSIFDQSLESKKIPMCESEEYFCTAAKQCQESIIS